MLRVETLLCAPCVAEIDTTRAHAASAMCHRRLRREPRPTRTRGILARGVGTRGSLACRASVYREQGSLPGWGVTLDPSRRGDCGQRTALLTA
jgi:hypothetical protein